MSSPHVLILYNEPVLPLDHPDAASEHDVLYTVEVVTKLLTQGGLTVEPFGAPPDPAALIPGLRARAYDVVFNLYEGRGDLGNTEAFVAGTMEWLRIPFNGSPAQAMILARNKPVTKHLLVGAGISTPEFLVTDGPLPPNGMGWPVIVKPAREDASVGIDQGSVVTNDRDLRDRVDFILARYGPPALVERFIHGREIHASLCELGDTDDPTVLPFAEILFEKTETGRWPIYSYDAKWKETSRDHLLTPIDVPVPLPWDVTERLTRAAKKLYRLLGCRDFARVDARLTADGEVFVLECNPNPSITSLMLKYGLESANWTESRFLCHMARRAAARGGLITVNPYG